MMTPSNVNIFRVTGLLCGEFTGHRWIPPNKGQWRGALMFSFICAWTDSWANNGDAGDLRRYRAHYDIIVMLPVAETGISRPNWLSSMLDECITVKPVDNDHLMGYFSVFWSSSRWPRATEMSPRRQKLLARVNWYLQSPLKHITE